MAELKTIKELALELDCSYEAVRQHVKRYQRQLSDHISYIGKSQYLDEWACNFIKSKRVESPITVRTVERHERIAELEQENKNLLIKVTEQAEELRAADKALAEVNVLLLSAAKDKERAEALEAQNDDLSAEIKIRDEILEETKKTAEKANMELSEALKRIEELQSASLMKRLFGWKKEKH